MRLDWNETIGGQKLIKIRDMLRYIGHGHLSAESVAERFSISDEIAKSIVEDLRKKGWIEPSTGGAGLYYGPDGAEFFVLTMLGNAVAGARKVKRITRERADRLVAEIRDRIERVNADEQLGYYVKEAWLFGSYLDEDAKDFGDIDLAIEFAIRPIIGRDIVNYSIERARLSEKARLNFFDQVGHCELEVRRYLKKRSPYISMHPLSDLKATKSAGRLLFKAPDVEAEPRQERPGSVPIETAVEPKHDMENQVERYLVKFVRPRFEIAVIEVRSDDSDNVEAKARKHASVGGLKWKLVPFDDAMYGMHAERCVAESDLPDGGPTLEEYAVSLRTSEATDWDRYLLLYGDIFAGEGRLISQPWLDEETDLMVRDLCADWSGGLVELPESREN